MSLAKAQRRGYHTLFSRLLGGRNSLAKAQRHNARGLFLRAPSRTYLFGTGRQSGSLKTIICLSLLFLNFGAVAQQDDTSKITIKILNTRLITFNKTDSGEYRKFIDSVAFLEGTDTLFCDSAYQNSLTKNFEAFGNVRISQTDGTQGTSDYLRYTSDKKLAYMKGNVTLTDGKNKLNCEALTYDLGTKTGEYFDWGTLHSDSTYVTSKTGVYNVHTKDARFKVDVLITDPKYHITSQDLGYNTETKVETFYALSTVTSDSGRSILVTSEGTYDSKNVIARFTGHFSIWDNGEYIEADNGHYNKFTGYGYAIGHVVSIDTAHHSTLKCGHAVYFRRQRILWAMIKPVMEQVNGKDTIFMRADTFYTAPMAKVVSRKSTVVSPGDSNAVENPKTKNQIPTVVDSSAVENPNSKFQIPKVVDSSAMTENTIAKTDSAKKQSKSQIPNHKFQTWRLPDYKYRIPDFMTDTSNARPVRVMNEPNVNQQQPTLNTGKKARKSKVKVPKLKMVDTAEADTTAPMYFVGYNHVKIFSDSMQGKCDSVCYTRSDSTIRMINIPILWAHNSQITGDTILLYLDSNKLRKMYVPNNAFLVSRSGPEQAHLFDQVQGKTLTGYFKNNEITDMTVYPNAECIYYATDKDKAYIGVDEATSTRMRIFFANQNITFIKFTQDAKHTITPLEKADLPGMKLSRFKWLYDQRPMSKEELFE